jgi:hypothetical protein
MAQQPQAQTSPASTSSPRLTRNRDSEPTYGLLSDEEKLILAARIRQDAVEMAERYPMSKQRRRWLDGLAGSAGRV